MNTSTIKSFAQNARKEFRKIVAERAHSLGISDDGQVARGELQGDTLIINGQPFPAAIQSQREALARLVKEKGFSAVVDSMAYTLFNRFSALRFMEVHGYLPFKVLSSSAGSASPDILQNAVDASETLNMPEPAKKRVREMKAAGDKDQQLYKLLLIAQCNELFKSMPFLFEPLNDFSELLIPENLLNSDSIAKEFVSGIDEADWSEIEIIGWLYQFYISERKDEVMGKVVAKEDIPAATQLFTPKWIVRYMVENSLGRLWLENHPDSALKAKMPYYIDDPKDVEQPKREILKVDTPDEIRCLDDACGSGHILVYMFDLLYEIYDEQGYPKPEIPSLILKHNLFGLDIDDRAAQLANFAVMMKAREKDARFLSRGVLPNVLAIQESNGIDLESIGVKLSVGAKSPFSDADSLLDDPDVLPAASSDSGESPELKRLKLSLQPLVRLFLDAKNYGSLLTVKESLAESFPQILDDLKAIERSDSLFGDLPVEQLRNLIKQAEILARKYHVCVTNPPYMGGKGLNSLLKDYAKEEFPDSKSDLCTMFIERNLTFLKKNGFVAMITMQSWMFLSSFEELRAKILKDDTILSMAHLGPRAFDSIGGEVVQTTAFVLCNCHLENYNGIFIRLVEGASEHDKSAIFLEALSI